MPKVVSLFINSISYNGKSVGRDFLIKFEISDDIFEFQKIIKIGETLILHKNILNKIVEDENKIIKITVLEKDVGKSEEVFLEIVLPEKTTKIESNFILRENKKNAEIKIYFDFNIEKITENITNSFLHILNEEIPREVLKIKIFFNNATTKILNGLKINIDLGFFLINPIGDLSNTSL
jgi:hypothetical protein